MAKSKKYYVTMTDKFMSGWGNARGKINKFIVICDTLDQAYTVSKNASYRPEMKYINVLSKKPNYDPKRYEVSVRYYKTLGKIWKKR